jgi:hypothetical protein
MPQKRQIAERMGFWQNGTIRRAAINPRMIKLET